MKSRKTPPTRGLVGVAIRGVFCSGCFEDGRQTVRKQLHGPLVFLLFSFFCFFGLWDAHGSWIVSGLQVVSGNTEEGVAGSRKTLASPPSDVVVGRVLQLKDNRAKLPMGRVCVESVLSTCLVNQFSQAGSGGADTVFRGRVAAHAMRHKSSDQSAESGTDEAAANVSLGNERVNGVDQGWSWWKFLIGALIGFLGAIAGALLSRMCFF